MRGVECKVLRKNCSAHKIAIVCVDGDAIAARYRRHEPHSRTLRCRCRGATQGDEEKTLSLYIQVRGKSRVVRCRQTKIKATIGNGRCRLIPENVSDVFAVRGLGLDQCNFVVDWR